MKMIIFYIVFLSLISARIFAQNVGIGTTTPAAKLDVKSTSSYVSQFNGAAPMYLGFFENDVYRGYLGSYSGAAEDMDFGTGSGNTNGKLHLTIQASPKLTINASGNVGIGTTTPNYKLHISTGDLFVESSIGKIIFGFAATNQWLISSAGSGADLKWNTTTDGGTNTTSRHYFKQNGDVGIGGFSGSLVPQARLHVISSGSANSTNNLMLQNSAGDTLLRMLDDGHMGIWYNGGSYARTLNLGGNGMNFYTAGKVFGGAIFPTDTSLVIWSNNGTNNYVILEPTWGKVGIGTYYPGAKLDVHGSMIIGASGTLINNIIKVTDNVNVGSVAPNSSLTQLFAVTNAAAGATVAISPALGLPSGLLIAYARVSPANTVEVKFTNVTGLVIDPAAMDYYITVIQ
jgi:hypothetical protein